jgi:hypothetical protein
MLIVTIRGVICNPYYHVIYTTTLRRSLIDLPMIERRGIFKYVNRENSAKHLFGI